MDRIIRWEHAVEWPLTIAAVVFLAAYATPIVKPDAPAEVALVCETVTWIVWGCFAVDYGVRLVMAPDRWTFVKHNLLDLAAVLLPVLRPLRLVRLLALVSILQRTGAQELRGRVITYTVGVTTLLVVVGALAMTDAERGTPGANITSVADGIWWALTTITTVGYGDRYPVTVTGRCIAAALMIGGIALLGVITATMASWLVERVSETTEQQQAATREQVDRLADEVRTLRAELGHYHDSSGESCTPLGPTGRVGQDSDA